MAFVVGMPHPATAHWRGLVGKDSRNFLALENPLGPLADLLQGAVARNSGIVVPVPTWPPVPRNAHAAGLNLDIGVSEGIACPEQPISGNCDRFYTPITPADPWQVEGTESRNFSHPLRADYRMDRTPPLDSSGGAYRGPRSSDHRNAHAVPVGVWEVAWLPDNVQRRQEFLETSHRARSESRRHHELRLGARTLDHPCDSAALGASAIALHTE